jgi:DNA-binding transcriptional MerR regulator
MNQAMDNNTYTAEQVCLKCGLAPYILRYWELHFEELRDAAGKRKTFYTSNDIALVWRIKRLLYVELLTVDQAKKKLRSEKLFPISEPGFGSTAPHRNAPAQEQVQTQETVPVAERSEPVQAAPQAIAENQQPVAQQPAQPSAEQLRAEQRRRYEEAVQRAQMERRKVLRRRQVEAAITELRELRQKLG